MEPLDITETLRDTLTNKQALVRDYQNYAKRIKNAAVSKMYSHFAEAEALQATQIKEQLDQLS